MATIQDGRTEATISDRIRTLTRFSKITDLNNPDDVLTKLATLARAKGFKLPKILRAVKGVVLRYLPTENSMRERPLLCKESPVLRASSVLIKKDRITLKVASEIQDSKMIEKIPASLRLRRRVTA